MVQLITAFKGFSKTAPLLSGSWTDSRESHLLRKLFPILVTLLKLERSREVTPEQESKK